MMNNQHKPDVAEIRDRFAELWSSLGVNYSDEEIAEMFLIELGDE